MKKTQEIEKGMENMGGIFFNNKYDHTYRIID